MSDLRRAEKIASAKKRLKQFQQKNRDSQSESGRSTPSTKKHEEEYNGILLGKTFESENGGSTFSLSQSENLSSNISRTESPLLASNNSLDNLSEIFNGNSHVQPDIINVSNTIGSLPKVNQTFFQTPSPKSFFGPPAGHSGSDFFDNLSSGNDLNEPHQGQDTSQIPALNVAAYHLPRINASINASTPDGPCFQDTPNYSFPDASVSPINEVKNITNNSEGAVPSELELQLKNTLVKNADLEQQLTEQKNQILQLQSYLEDMKAKADEGASTLKHHVQAIEILVSEKTELQNSLDKKLEEIQTRSGEVEELQSRLRASRHRVSELERELGVTRARVQALETSLKEESTRHINLMQRNDNLGKQVGDLELEVSDLHSKLESQNHTTNLLKSELQEKISQLSLAEVRIQQLSGGPDMSGKAEEELRQKNEELLQNITTLENQLGSEKAAKEESVKEYQQYVNRLHSEMQELKILHDATSERCSQLEVREQDLVRQVSEMERQLSRVPQPKEDPALQLLREQLQEAQQHIHLLKSQLESKTLEVEALQEGLQERALTIQELEVKVERLETDRPDTAILQAAIESDKVAASRAVAQNNALKKQLEELQEAVVKLSNSKLELTQQLQHEQHLSRDLSEKLQKLQESKGLETEKEQQTESPLLQESESQTTFDQPIVSPEVMLKLQEKFRKTMSELADMSDEKQRLEHLVMQLQSETETIGEYITLYQIQRGMLRQRAQEKDEQVQRLAQDKEVLRNKLAQLNCLVQQLVGSSGNRITTNGLDLEAADDGTMRPQLLETQAVPTHHASTVTSMETAQQIQSLLTEIGSHNLVTSPGENTNNINFHPCPWCSGRLITV